MKVLYVTTEIFPLIKTGGLGQVSAELPLALQKAGVEVKLLMPGIPAIMDGVKNLKKIATFKDKFKAKNVTLHKGIMKHNKLETYVIEAPELYQRIGNPYTDASGTDWGDNHLRFALLGWIAGKFAEEKPITKWTPDVIHAHDWHAGLVPAYVKATPNKQKPTTVFTIHNLAYQGTFPPEKFNDLELPKEFFSPEGLEFHYNISFMKAGIYYADKITTVSPTYAEEIQTYEHGFGMEGLLQSRAQDVTGILNGMNYEKWDPMTDKRLNTNYDSHTLSLKHKNKTALQKKMGLKIQSAAPLLCAVTRLIEQKGLYLIIHTMPEIVKNGAQVMILGSGDKHIEDAFEELKKQYPKNLATHKYDLDMPHEITAGSDMILVPSRFEPCGLSQLQALSYGTLPLVRRIGGLADTVVDTNLQTVLTKTATGFTFENMTISDFMDALKRAFETYKDKKLWHAIQKRAMKQNFSWNRAANEYIDIYNTQMELIEE